MTPTTLLGWLVSFAISIKQERIGGDKSSLEYSTL